LHARGLVDAAEHPLRAALDLSVAAPPELRLVAELRLADNYLFRSRFDEAEAILCSVVEECRQQGNLRTEATALSDLCRVCRERGDRHGARKYSQQGLELARKIGNRRLEGRLLGNLANQLHALGDLEAALGQLKQALAMLLESGDRATYALFLGNLGVLSAELGDHAAERSCFEQAAEEHRRLGARHALAITLSNLSSWHAQHGSALDACRCGLEAVELFGEIGDPVWLSWALTNLATGELKAGRLAAAEARFAESLGCLHEGTAARHTESLLLWARARLERPEMAEARNPATHAMLARAAAAIPALGEPLASELRSELEGLLQRQQAGESQAASLD
jgi:tetratricopeptide (TPR) repeat protein